MVVEADFYRVRLRFKRLFADPAIFEDQKNAVRRFLSYPSPSNDQVAIYQITDNIAPIDNVGKSPDVAGTARYVHRGRVVRSEYLENARSEEHTSELQSPYDLVCRLLLEKKKHRAI